MQLIVYMYRSLIGTFRTSRHPSPIRRRRQDMQKYCLPWTGSATTSMYQCGGGNASYAGGLTVPSIPCADYRFVWTIPLSERQQNPNYEQNPRY
jgi:hypothetical protein